MFVLHGVILLINNILACIYGYFLLSLGMKKESSFPFYNGVFNDKRIDNRANSLLFDIINSGTVTINRCCLTHSDRIGAYRMLNNRECSEEALSSAMYQSCMDNVRTSHVLCIQDTTEFNYNAHIGRIGTNDPDIGPVTKDSHSGFFCHPMLVVDPLSHLPLGISFLKLWNRSRDKQNRRARHYQQLPMEEKESYRWIESSDKSLRNLPSGTIQTVIADREGDIYQSLCSIPNEHTHLLIRSSANRILTDEDCLLLEKMRSMEIQAEYVLEIRGHDSRKSRTARIALRYGSVRLSRPHTCPGTYPDSLPIHCIYVAELPHTVPQGEEPIEWRLLTTHPIETVEQAMECVNWYKCRWFIEELFRLVKSQGLDMETAQLESGSALKKLLLIALPAALRIMALKLGYDSKNENMQADLFFNESEQRCMLLLHQKMEGKTAKLKNPYRKYSLPWAAWLIARLGGWAGYESSAKPGYITFKRGIDIFDSKYDVFQMMDNQGYIKENEEDEN